MKKNKKSKETTKFVIFVLCIIAYIILRGFSNDETKKIMSEGQYAIAEVIYIDSGSGSIFAPRGINQPGNSGYIKYKYIVDNTEIIHQYDNSTSRIPFEKVQVGEKYIVAYLKDNPEKSRLLFDKPIKDISDFQRYIDELGNSE